MTRFNSLLGSNKFPVPMRRELARKSLNLALDSEPTIHSGAPANKIPCIFPASREFGFRDEFAQDCLLQRRVTCEPDFFDRRARGANFVRRHRFEVVAALFRTWSPYLDDLEPFSAQRTGQHYG